tara:strand:+ start:12606 stop:14090 length:1485 start_codon:yes stop_codon:yes gene_type:complete
MKIYNYILILLIILVICNLKKNKLIEGHISGDPNSNNQVYTHCDTRTDGEFTCSITGEGTFLEQLDESGQPKVNGIPMADDLDYIDPDNIEAGRIEPSGYHRKDCRGLSQEECPLFCDSTIIYPEQECNDIDASSFWLFSRNIDYSEPLPRFATYSNYPNYEHYPFGGTGFEGFDIVLPLNKVRNSYFYDAVDQIAVLLGLDLDNKFYLRTPRSPIYCGLTEEITRFSKSVTMVDYSTNPEGEELRGPSSVPDCNRRPDREELCLDEIRRPPEYIGPVSIKIGHPDKLNGRWHFRGMYNNFPEYVGGTGHVYNSQSNSFRDEIRSDYYHIYYGPLRGGICHGNDTGWQIRPIDESIYDIKLEIEEKKRIEIMALLEKGKSQDDINRYIQSRDDHYWLKGPSSTTYPSIKSFLSSLGWSKNFDTTDFNNSGRPVLPSLTICNDFACGGPTPANVLNTNPSLLCDDPDLTNEADKQECLRNRRFFTYGDINLLEAR